MAFTRFTKNVLNVSALPDRIQNQANALKATFDQAGVDIKAALNALIAELEASTSADNIGADVQSVATKTVQAILTAFEEAIGDRYTKTEAETLLAAGTNNLVADIDVNLTTGVITITKKDGTVETIDTAIEKVPAKFEIVESGDTFALKITNVDGTSTQTDITNFMNIYNFNNSDYITFEVAGEGNQKTVTANIKANSIGLDKLSLSVVSTLEGYMNSARDSATAAKTSEVNARASELSALEAKNTAVNKAAEATNSASAAKVSETNAAKSAEDAEYWAKQAENNGGSGGGGITEIPVATADTLGGIKVGDGLEITKDGVLSTITDNESGYSKTELISSDITTTGNHTLLDNIFNYDEIHIEAYATSGSNKIYTGNRKIIPSHIVGGNNADYAITEGGEGRFHLTVFGFSADGSQILVQGLYKGSSWSDRTVGISHITGIKYGGNYIINGEKFEVDKKPTARSENLITSGGVFEAIDNIPFKVLEASTDNVIDFNTLTETGVYLIRNCSDGRGTTLNCFFTNANYRYDVIMQVRKHDNTNGELASVAQFGYSTIGLPYYRTFNPSTNIWTEWTTKVSASNINAGTLQGKVKASSSAVATLTDTQIRNIQASTTDLTAGTSTLTTGDIYLVYE